MSFTIGENVGPYRIIAQQGSGGMATVYKAYHAALDRYVAIKVLHPVFKEEPNFLARFQREARIVAKLEHPHIVPVYDFSEHGGQPYLVMRFVEGETLKARLQAGRLTLSQIMDIMRPVCQALTYAHEQGVLHRDVKPSNVLLTPGGGVFLTDFGLAKMALSGESTLSHESLLGTPQYISPEQAQGKANLDARTDVYSLGVVLYELLVGRVPYQADTPYAVVHDHIFTPLPLPRSLNPNLPEPIERVLLKALSKERDDRYASVADLLAALEKAVTEVGTPGSTVVAPKLPVEQGASTVLSAAPQASTAATVVSGSPAAPAQKSGLSKWRKRLIALGAVVLVLFCAFALLSNLGAAKRHADTARQLRDAGRFEEALVEYEQARQSNRRLVEAYVEPAEMLINRGQPGDFVRAGELCEQGVLVAKDDAQLRACAAHAWFASGDMAQAVPHVEWLLQNKAGGAMPHAAKSLLLLDQGNVDAAQAEAQEAIRIDPDAPEGHLALGQVHVATRRPGQARQELEMVVSSPRAPAWMRMRARRMLDELPK